MRITDEAHRLHTERRREYERLPTYPLKVTLHMQAPFASDGHICPEGMLSYASALDIWGDMFFQLSGTYLHSLNITLPLKPQGFNAQDGTRDWFWKCSCLLWNGCDGVTSWKKRFDEEYSDYIDFGKKKKAITIANGFYKNYSQPLVIHSAPLVYFFCVGNKPALDNLLQYITAFGKKTSQGFGAISSFETEVLQDDHSTVFQHGDTLKPMRFLPAEYFKAELDRRGLTRFDAHINTIGIRPPYWDRMRRQYVCMVPPVAS